MGGILMPKLLNVKATWETERVEKNIEDLTDNIDAKINEVFKLNEPWAVAWMKLNAPWTDITGRARGGLSATTSQMGNIHEMLLYYTGVNYGIWLEIANSGRFQILGPAMRYVSAKILKDIESVIEKKPLNISMPGNRDIPPQARKTARKGTVNKSGSRRSRKAYGQRNRGNRT